MKFTTGSKISITCDTSKLFYKVDDAVEFQVKFRMLFVHFSPNRTHQPVLFRLLVGASSDVAPFSFVQGG
jgi:hypothetical protein